MNTIEIKVSKEELLQRLSRSYVSPFKDYYFELKKLGYGFSHSRGDLEIFSSNELDMFLLGKANGRGRFILIGNDMDLSIGDETNICIAGAKEICPFDDGVYIPSAGEKLIIKKKKKIIKKDNNEK